MWIANLIRANFLTVGCVLLFACSDAAEEVTDTQHVPQNTVAVSSSNEVILSWDPVEGAERYGVCWAYVTITDCSDKNPRVIYKDNVGTLNPNTGRIEWTHKNITNDTLYNYVIFAYSTEWGNSPISININGKPTGINPPTVISIAADGLVPTLSWEPVSGAAGYNVYMANAFGVTKENWQTLSGMKHPVTSPDATSRWSFTHSPLASGEYYSFVVTAYRDVNGITLESEDSQELQFIPRQRVPEDDLYLPHDFKITAGFSELIIDPTTGDQKIDRFNITWSDACQDISSAQFKVFWSPDAPFTAHPTCDLYPCKTDASPRTIDLVITQDLDPAKLYYFAMHNSYTSICGTNTTIPTVTTDYSSQIGLVPPRKAYRPTITATPDVNAVTIEVDTNGLDPTMINGLRYNLYMAAGDACNNPLTVENYLDDTKWGMLHSNIPISFKHVALPGGLPFCFIVTSVNEAGTESPASDMVTSTPLTATVN